MMHTFYKRYSWFLILVTFMVISAGGIVRMTQSGMGCPDWPTCFGMIIPPLSEDQLPADYQKYLDKQDIDHSFNVYHTWIEYINRLIGALLGIFILVYVGMTMRKWKAYRREDPRWSNLLLISIVLLIAVGIVGFLGKIVVDKNLEVFMITLHMMFALTIGILPLLNIFLLDGETIRVPLGLRWVALALIPLLIAQIYMGTQVREEIDIISKTLEYKQRDLWIARLGYVFDVHRSFSWSLIIGACFVYYKSLNISRLRNISRNILFMIAAIVGLGIVMNYFGMPAVAQPLHLLLASILLVQIVYLNFVLRVK